MRLIHTAATSIVGWPWAMTEAPYPPKAFIRVRGRRGPPASCWERARTKRQQRVCASVFGRSVQAIPDADRVGGLCAAQRQLLVPCAAKPRRSRDGGPSTRRANAQPTNGCGGVAVCTSNLLHICAASASLGLEGQPKHRRYRSPAGWTRFICGVDWQRSRYGKRM